MTVASSGQAVATSGPANAAAALLLAVFLAIVAWRGNLGALAGAARTDFLGAPGQPAFWRWAVALLILIMLSQWNATKALFGPILAISLVAMLINMATNHPENLAALNKSIAWLFGQQSTGN